jgi:acetoin utilization deacetylase AcuC-like enzyme
VIGARDRIWDWQPELLFITCGADGHKEDPLTSLEYSVEGYIAVAKRLKERFPDLPILLGGAGGYLPDTRTPEMWAQVAAALAHIPPLSDESSNGLTLRSRPAKSIGDVTFSSM